MSRSALALRSLISGASLDESIRTVKHVAKQVPLWVTIVAWSVLGATYALFCVRT